MATVDVTEASFDQTVRQGIVLLDFWAGWCGPCRMFAPIFEAASRKHPDVVFGKVDTEAQPELAGAFQIRALPTLVVLRDGVVLGSQPGLLSAAALDELLGKVRAIDMNDVRRRLDAAGHVKVDAGQAPEAHGPPTEARARKGGGFHAGPLATSAPRTDASRGGTPIADAHRS